MSVFTVQVTVPEPGHRQTLAYLKTLATGCRQSLVKKIAKPSGALKGKIYLQFSYGPNRLQATQFLYTIGGKGEGTFKAQLLQFDP
jgi:hypothetical protein